MTKKLMLKQPKSHPHRPESRALPAAHKLNSKRIALLLGGVLCALLLKRDSSQVSAPRSTEK